MLMNWSLLVSESSSVLVFMLKKKNISKNLRFKVLNQEDDTCAYVCVCTYLSKWGIPCRLYWKYTLHRCGTWITESGNTLTCCLLHIEMLGWPNCQLFWLPWLEEEISVNLKEGQFFGYVWQTLQWLRLLNLLMYQKEERLTAMLAWKWKKWVALVSVNFHSKPNLGFPPSTWELPLFSRKH